MDNTTISLFKKLTPGAWQRQGSERKLIVPDFFFKIHLTHGTATVETVTHAGQPGHFRAEHYEGAVAAALRSMSEIESSAMFDWMDGTPAGGIANLHAYPWLLYRLMRCPNLVDGNLNPIKVETVPARLFLNIAESQSGDGLLKASFIAETENTSGIVTAMLSDSFAIAGDTIFALAEPIGDNYGSLDVFTHSFEADSLDAFLAIFYTYVTNVKVRFDGHKIIHEQEPADCVPTIAIEKIDSDKALYLRLVDSVPDGGGTIVDAVHVNWTVQTSDSGRITVRPLRHINLDEEEEQLLRQIRAYAPDRATRAEVFLNDGLFIIPEQAASPFRLQGLPKLLKNYRVTGIDKLREYKLRPVQPKMSVKFSPGIDYLESSAEVELGNERMTLQELLDQYRRHRYVRLADGDIAVIDEAYMRRLQRIFSGNQDKDGRFKISFFDLPEIERLLDDDAKACDELRRPRDFYAGFSRLADARLTLPQVNATLRNYQTEGVKWLKYLYDNHMGGCLADDMGLGKTLQVISLLSLVYPDEKTPSLIVMPRSLLFNWHSELSRFIPWADVTTYYGSGRDLPEAMNHQIILTTYAVVRNDVELLSKQKFHMVVLDESQTIKNVTAQQTRSVFLLNADHRFALSGTPIENNLSELYSLFRFINPGMFGSLDDFNRRYAAPIQHDDKDVAADLRRKIFPFILRRLKKDVLNDLPERVEQTVYVDMEAPKERLYEQRRKYYLERIRESIATEGLHKSRFVMLQALSELRQIATVPENLSDGKISSAKLEVLADRVTEAVENGHKVVVFFNFIAGIEILGERLDRGGIGYEIMTGATHDRSGAVKRFQTDPDCRVFLMTLKTGGVGLNLTAADIVFIAEPWWNKAAEEQAISRLHRIGQKSTVFSFSLITHGTIEEKILQLQQMKAELFDSIISSDDATSPKTLTEDDINFILG